MCKIRDCRPITDTQIFAVKISLWTFGHFFFAYIYIFIIFFITLNRVKKWAKWPQHPASPVKSRVSAIFKSGQKVGKSGHKSVQSVQKCNFVYLIQADKSSNFFKNDQKMSNCPLSNSKVSIKFYLILCNLQYPQYMSDLFILRK